MNFGRKAVSALAAGPAHLDSFGRVRPNREESGYLVYYRNQAAVDSAGAAEALVAERHTLDPSADPVEGLLELVMAQPRGKTSPPPCRRGVSLRSWTLNNGLLTVDFSSTYGTLSGIDLTLADYSVVLTPHPAGGGGDGDDHRRGEMLSYRDHQRMTAEDIVS